MRILSIRIEILPPHSYGSIVEVFVPGDIYDQIYMAMGTKTQYSCDKNSHVSVPLIFLKT